MLLVNTRSRQGRERYAEAHRTLTEQGVRLLDVKPILKPTLMGPAVRDALRAGARRILIGGGDGTLSAAVQELAGSDAVLGVIPMGTGNDFARSLGIPPRDLRAACEIIAAGHVQRVDLGRCDRRCFLNAASLGLTANIARRLTSAFKQKTGAFAYPLAALAQAWSQAPFHVRITARGRVQELEVLQVVVGNGRFQGGGQLIAPDAGLQDRLLDLYAVLAPEGLRSSEPRTWQQVRSFAGLASVALKLLRGRHLEHEQVLHLRASSVTVEADPPQPLNLDGELIGRTPAKLRVAPGALSVLVPRSARL